MRLSSIVRAVVLLLALLSTAACAGNKIPILVGQSGLAVASSIEALSAAGKQLQEASVIPTAAALGFQKTLLAANEQLKPLPDILRTIDRLQEANDPTATETDRAIAILTVVGQDLSIVIAGVPISATTAKLIDLVRAAQQAVMTVLVEVAKVKGREA